MTSENNAIGEAIKQARKKAGMTQKQLAEKCEMADSAIRKYESGRIVPKIKTIAKIATALGMHTSDFIPKEDEFSDEREFYAIREILFWIRLKTKQEHYANPESDIDKATRKKWLYELAPKIAEKYAVSEESLKNSAETVEWLSTDIHLMTEIDHLPEHHQQMIDLMDMLNEDGQRVAVARIEELAQIPKYQKRAPEDTGPAE